MKRRLCKNCKFRLESKQCKKKQERGESKLYVPRKGSCDEFEARR